MVCHSNHPHFLVRKLVNDAVGKSSQKLASPRAPKDSPDHGVFQNALCRALKLSNKRQTKIPIGLYRVEIGGIL
jgi:hypothetical protein